MADDDPALVSCVLTTFTQMFCWFTVRQFVKQNKRQDRALRLDAELSKESLVVISKMDAPVSPPCPPPWTPLLGPAQGLGDR